MRHGIFGFVGRRHGSRAERSMNECIVCSMLGSGRQAGIAKALDCVHKAVSHGSIRWLHHRIIKHINFLQSPLRSSQAQSRVKPATRCTTASTTCTPPYNMQTFLSVSSVRFRPTHSLASPIPRFRLASRQPRIEASAPSQSEREEVAATQGTVVRHPRGDLDAFCH